MFEIMNGATGNALAVRATGKLSAADYRELLAPQLESMLARSGALNVLFVMDETFERWSVGAAWANTVLDFKYRRDFSRVAMVGGPRWEE
jgi:hypothetical protein